MNAIGVSLKRAQIRNGAMNNLLLESELMLATDSKRIRAKLVGKIDA